MFRLDDRTALITGASQGIGAGIAQAMATQGARVVLAARSVDKLEVVAASIREAGGEARTLALDVADREALKGTLAALDDEWPIDILVNNAGITRDNLFARMKPEQWSDVIETNLTGAYAVTRELVRPMMRRRFGRILFISSVVGLMGNTGQVNYAASKAGLIGMSKSLARELGGRHITSNVIAPGYIETAMTEKLDDKARGEMTKQIALRRIGTVDDIAGVAVFLASDAGAYVTGDVLNVSGGLYI